MRKVPRRGIGAILLLAGSVLVYPASTPLRKSSLGGVAGYLLLLVGLGFLREGT